MYKLHVIKCLKYNYLNALFSMLYAFLHFFINQTFG